MTVLVLAQELDRTVDAVVTVLVDRDVPVFRMDRAWFPQRLTLDAELRDGRWQGYLATEDRRVELAEVRSIWYRSPSPFVFPAAMSEAERKHAEQEARIGLGGVLTSLPVRQVNHPHRAAAATKPWQLTVAAACGLSVPVTRIVNREKAALEFVTTADSDVVSKLFANRVVEEGRSKVGHTHLLTAADLADLRGLTSRHISCSGSWTSATTCASLWSGGQRSSRDRGRLVRTTPLTGAPLSLPAPTRPDTHP